MAKIILYVLLLAIIFIGIGFYFTRNFEEKRRLNTRIFLVSFLLPFSNMVLFLVSGFIPKDFLFISPLDSLGYAISGLIYMLMILPLCFIISLLFYLVRKNIIYMKTVLLTFLFGGILIFCSLFFVYLVEEIKVMLSLGYYKPVIESIEKYKSKNKFYPKDLSLIGINKKKYSNYRYELMSNERDYILSVYASSHNFYYCSNPKYDGCHTKDGFPIKYVQHGKWIEAINQD